MGGAECAPARLTDAMRIKGLWAPHDPRSEPFGPPSSCLSILIVGIIWQEWQGSNLRPPVLETGALPIELHSYGPSRRHADQGCFQAQGAAGLQGRIARVKRAGFACLYRCFWATLRSR